MEDEKRRDAITLKAMRAYLKLSQREFAKKLGASYSTIAGIEASSRRLTENLKYKIAIEFPPTNELLDAIAAARRADELLE